MSDFNGDGKLDFAVPNISGGTLSIYLNQGGGTFSTPVITNLQSGNIFEALIAGDLNGDGKTDLVVSTQFATQVIVVLLGNGDGTFKELPQIPGSVAFLSGKIADFNNDGLPDLFLGGNGEPYLYLGNGDGTFVPQAIPNGSFPGDYLSVVTGDFNGDKKLDAIGADYCEPPCTLGSIDFFTGDGSGNFAAPVFYPSPSVPDPFTLDVADFNHDGKLELAIGGSGAYVAFGNGDGTFQANAGQLIPLAVPPYEGNIPKPDTYNVVVSDLDQNGTPDVAALDSKTGMLSLFLNDGTGAFPNAKATPYTFQLPANTFEMAVADINGDGLPDIIVSNGDNKTITLLLSKVNLVADTVTLTSSASSVLIGAPLTFTVKVASASSTPAGTVTLMDGATQVGQQTLDAAGSATFTTSDFVAGVHPLTASYSGNAQFASATSSPLSQAVTDFQVALTPATQTIAAGSTASYSVAITPVGGFAGSVSLACSGLPALASCTVQDVPVSSGVASQTVVVTTAAPTKAMFAKKSSAIYACAFLGGFSLCFGRSRKTRRTFHPLTLLSLIVIAPLALGVFGCGGNSSPQPIPGTPSGSSTLTITATVTQNGVTVMHAATGTLVIQ